ncbi:MAG: hypothetical protein JJU36_03550 [Phycisphaeraceae bacterium]|nr:hypothetical protein [Phycisphaeraceae bacterium]
MDSSNRSFITGVGRLGMPLAVVLSLLVHVAALNWIRLDAAPGPVREPTRLMLEIHAPSRAVAGDAIELRWRILPDAEAQRLESLTLSVKLKIEDETSEAQPITLLARQGLTPPSKRPATENLTLPSDMPAGRHELVVHVAGPGPLDDGQGTVTLRAARPITVLPDGMDLSIEAMDLFPAARGDPSTSADSVVTRISVRNLGGRAPDHPWIDRLYLSDKPEITPVTRMLGDWAWKPAGIAEGGYRASLQWDAMLHAPDFPGPTAWLIAVVDATEHLDDLDRSNNVKMIEIDWSRILAGQGLANLPNLKLVELETVPEVAAGELFAVDVLFANTGEAPAAGPWKDEVVLLSEDMPEAPPRHLARLRRDKTIEPDQTDEVSNTLRLPADLPPGEYRLRYTLNADEQVREQRRDDNELEVKVTVLPGERTIPLGDDRPPDEPTVAWLSWDDFLEHYARQSRTLQPELENRPVHGSTPAQTMRSVRPAPSMSALDAAAPARAQPQRPTPSIPDRSGEVELEPDDAVRMPALLTAGRDQGAADPFQERRPDIADRHESSEPEQEERRGAEEGRQEPAPEEGAADAEPTTTPEARQAEERPDRESRHEQTRESTAKTDERPGQPRQTPSPRPPTSDAGADAASLEPPRRDVRPGQVVAEEGIRIVTQHFDLPLSVLFMNRPRNPVVRIQFNTQGRVIRHEVVRGSGVQELDSAIVSGLYRWRATGEKLREIEHPFWREFTILLEPARR